MPRIDVFDPPMCCSTGVCGPVVDNVLPRFAGNLAWLARNGVEVVRYNLAQQPEAFAKTAAVLAILQRSGSDALPVVLVDGAVASQGRYPSREELLQWAGLPAEPVSTSPASISLPSAATCCDPDQGSGCCG